MEFVIDKSIVDLGIKSVVIGIAKNIDPQAPLSDSFLKKQKKMEDWALHCDVEAVSNHPITQGYADMLQSRRPFRPLFGIFNAAVLCRISTALSIFTMSNHYIRFWQ